MDTTAIGHIAAELMESIAEEYGDEVTIGEVAVVVELEIPPSDEDEYGATVVRYRCTDTRRWVQAGLLAQARRAVHNDDEGD